MFDHFWPDIDCRESFENISWQYWKILNYICDAAAGVVIENGLCPPSLSTPFTHRYPEKYQGHNKYLTASIAILVVLRFNIYIRLSLRYAVGVWFYPPFSSVLCNTQSHHLVQHHRRNYYPLLAIQNLESATHYSNEYIVRVHAAQYPPRTRYSLQSLGYRGVNNMTVLYDSTSNLDDRPPISSCVDHWLHHILYREQQMSTTASKEEWLIIYIMEVDLDLEDLPGRASWCHPSSKLGASRADLIQARSKRGDRRLKPSNRHRNLCLVYMVYGIMWRQDVACCFLESSVCVYCLLQDAR